MERSYSMNMKLNTNQQQMVLDNQRLVHYLVQKLGVAPNYIEYEDIVSIGTIGLIKAVITFDTSKNNTFTTYASRCINNEIFMHFRKANKYASNVSLDAPIGNDGEGNEITLRDKIEYSESNFIEKIINEEAFVQLISIILNYLESKQRLVMLYRIGNISQADIAELLNISRSYVSRIVQKATIKVREAIIQQIHYKEVFSMNIIGDTYKITFASKAVNNFNKIFATLLQNLTSVATLPDFKINCNKERIIIQIPAHPESFSFIGQIIQEIDDFSMEFVSDKNILHVNNDVLQKVKSDGTDKDDIIQKKETTVIMKNSDTSEVVKSEVGIQIEDTLELDTDADKKNTNIEQINTTRHPSQSKRIKEYILTLENFSVKQVTSHFPDIPVVIINNVIRLAKAKGLITAIAKDEYVVNKI